MGLDFLNNEVKIEDILSGLALFLKKELNIVNFIRTGAYDGAVTIWSAGNFEKVTSITSFEKSYDYIKSKISNHSNVNLLLGKSEEILPSIIDSMGHEPTLFFLDDYNFYQKDNENNYVRKVKDYPLIKELKQIAEKCKDMEYAIVIDSINVLLSNEEDIVLQLRDLVEEIDKEMHFVVYHDVLIVVPQRSKEVLNSYLVQDLMKSYKKN